MASKIQDLPLEELYARKMTASTELAIQSKEDFSKISTEYCTKVCKLKCKNPGRVILLKEEPLDILIVQDHAAPKGKWDKTDNRQEIIQRGIIDFICQKAGFQGLNYRITNMLKCAPNELDFPRGKAPTSTVLSKCKPYLLAEIERTKPNVIISLSTSVTKALGYTKLSNKNNRGEIVDGNVLITLHPRVLCMIRQNASGGMWGSDYFDVILRDFRKASNIARGLLTIKTLDQGIEEQRKNITICRSIKDVQDVVTIINTLPETYIVSVDTETTGLDTMAEDAKLLTIQFGWKNIETGIYIAQVIPLWHRKNNMYDADKAWELITPILLSKDIRKVTQNGKFDILYIYHTKGVRMQGMEIDTMLMLHALSSGESGCYGLKAAMWDRCIELGIAGYENKLPELTKVKKKNKEDPGEEVGDIEDESHD